MSFTEKLRTTPLNQRDQVLADEYSRRCQANLTSYVALPLHWTLPSFVMPKKEAAKLTPIIAWQLGLPGQPYQDKNGKLTRTLVSINIFTINKQPFTTDSEAFITALVNLLNSQHEKIST